MKTVLAFSGGLDSTCLLWYLRSMYHEVRCLSVDYGQRHNRELIAACRIARLAGVEHRVIDLRSVKGLMGGSSQTDAAVEVPEGHYTDESMKLTVVPNRNMLLLSLCTAWAISSKSDSVTYAAHAGDRAIYPDCRPEFANAIANAISICDWHKLELDRPFINATKAEIVRLGYNIKAPLHLTYSCYKGGEKHCGRCGTCTERALAFTEAGVPDPTQYER